MGNLLEKTAAAFAALMEVLSTFSVRHAKILMLGLDGAGKTTVLYKLKLKEIPTIGFKRGVGAAGELRNVTFTVWDVGGQDKIRPLWRHYFVGCEGLVYVVDSVDHERFMEARDELTWILNSEEMVGVPLVILANKQDMPRAYSPNDIATKLGLYDVRNRKWHIQGSSALSGQGFYESMEELSSLVKEFQAANHR